MGTCSNIKQCFQVSIDIPIEDNSISLKTKSKVSISHGYSKKDIKSDMSIDQSDELNQSLLISKGMSRKVCSSKINHRLYLDNKPKKKERLTSTYVMEGMVNTLAEIESSNNSKIVSGDISDDQIKFIKRILNDNNLFTHFDDDTFEEFIIGFFSFVVNKDHTIFKEKQEAKVFYIIEKGAVSLSSEADDNDRICKEGDFFGYEAFEEDSKRHQKAIAIEDSMLFGVSGDFYRSAITYMELKMITEKIEIIKKIPLFKNMDQSKLVSLCKILTRAEHHPNSIIINESECQDRIFIIQSGIVRVTRKFKKIQLLGPEGIFCQIGLFMQLPCYYTYSVDKEDLSLYELAYNDIKEVLGNTYIKDILFELFQKALYSSERINDILYQHQSELFYIFKLVYYEKGFVVFPSDAKKNKKICIMISGQLVRGDQKNEIVAKTEDLFGHQIIDSKQNLESNIISEEESLILEASWDDIIKESEQFITNNISLCDTVSQLKQIPIFSSLKETQYVELAKNINITSFKDGESISKEGEIVDKFYVIKKGKAKMSQKGQFIRDLDMGGCFGEIRYFGAEISLFTVVSVGITECFVCTKEDFKQFDFQLSSKLKAYSSLNDINIELNQLYYAKSLGDGRFGKVYLVHNQKHLYAIKYASLKTICQNKNLMKYYLNEKNIMLQLDHPFVIKLVKTLKNQEYLFFLLEYIDGIPLREYIEKRRKNKQKNASDVEFFGAILLNIINYLHSKRILHRDIKPDNCMIDKAGYLKLLDFGIAKDLKDQDFTTTLCGTPHYLAPEVILGKGYSFSSDYWSVGITMFEILYGYVPFGQGAKDFMGVYYDILNKKLNLPYEPKFNDVNSFFRTILSKNRIQRVCNYQLLKSHPFFNQFDFDQLSTYSIVPPYVPDSFIDKETGYNGNIISSCTVPILTHMTESKQAYENYKQTHYKQQKQQQHHQESDIETNYQNEKQFIDEF